MCRRSFAFVGYNFTGASFKMDVRITPDAASALISLTTQTTDVQGIRLTHAASDTIANQQAGGWLGAGDVAALLAQTNPVTGVAYQLTDIVLLSVIAVRIDKANMSALPFPQETGDNEPLFYDVHITPPGGDEDKYLGGAFTVLSGVTR